MTERPVKPANMPWLTPYLIVRDPERSLDFYQRAFGFIPDSQPLRDGSGKIVHAEMSYRDAYLMLGAEGAMGGTKKAPASSGVECPIRTLSLLRRRRCVVQAGGGCRRTARHGTAGDVLGRSDVQREGSCWLRLVVRDQRGGFRSRQGAADVVAVAGGYDPDTVVSAHHR